MRKEILIDIIYRVSQVWTIAKNIALEAFTPVLTLIGQGAQWIYDNWSMIAPEMCIRDSGKDVDLVVGNDGTFVPADKYNGANSGKTSAENALKAAAEALKDVYKRQASDMIRPASSRPPTLTAFW